MENVPTKKLFLFAFLLTKSSFPSSLFFFISSTMFEGVPSGGYFASISSGIHPIILFNFSSMQGLPCLNP